MAVLRAIPGPGPGQRGPALARTPGVTGPPRLVRGRVSAPLCPGLPGPRAYGLHRALVVHGRVGTATGRARDDFGCLVRLLLLRELVVAASAPAEEGWRASSRRHSLGAFTAQLRARIRTSVTGAVGWLWQGRTDKQATRGQGDQSSSFKKTSNVVASMGVSWDGRWRRHVTDEPDPIDCQTGIIQQYAWRWQKRRDGSKQKSLIS